MTTDAMALMEQGGAALAAGDWAEAERHLLRVVEIEPHPHALGGLGSASWWQGNIRDALRYWTAAYEGFRRTGATVEATMTAVQLALVYSANLGNATVAAGWVRRAARVAASVDEPALDGWIDLTRSVFSTDTSQAYELGQRAHTAATTYGDRDLEISAMTAMGLALVRAGKTDDGCALLDEAMTAAVAGEANTPDTVVFTSCLMMEACCTCADFPRVVHWVRVLDDFTAKFGNPYLMSSCRTHYGEVLANTGDWRRAEIELDAAMRLAADGLPRVQALAAACLAELRISQGRIDEARRLVAGFESRPEVAVVVARLALNDGAIAEARSTVTRQLERAGGEQIRSAQLRELIGGCHLAEGDHGAAAEIGRELTKIGTECGCEIIRCRGQRLLGQALTADGEHDEAREALESALAGFVDLELPLDVAHTHVALAELLAPTDIDLAIAEGRTALSIFDDLGASPAADRTARWLNDRGVTVARTGQVRGTDVLTRRETEVLALVGEGLSNPEMAERLYLSRRTVEHHVASVLSKLGLRNRAEAAAFAARHQGGFASK